MLVVKAHYIHDALSMSSLSPLLNGKADAGEDGEKKKKKKKEKKKSSDDEDDEELTEEEKAAKKEKKRLKKEKKAAEKAAAENDEEEDEEDSDEDKKKKKKKNKNKKGEITELMDDEIEQFGKHQPVVEVEEVFDPMNQHLRQLYVSDQNKPTTFKEEKQQV
jgi:cobalamin biosynthesis protein CobT